jgi:two-component system LytT family response regulator/two-component system response regulator LytT
MKISCLIVDDEPPAVDELSYILSGIEDVEIVATAFNSARAISAIRANDPDLVFLDIKMPGGDGFEVIRACGAACGPPFFVFVTAYDQDAVKAFEASAVDYVLKPFQAERILESVVRIRQMIATHRKGVLYGRLERIVERLTPAADAPTKIGVEKKGRILLLDPEEIVFCKAENKTVRVCTHERCYDLWGASSLDELEAKLGGHCFFRTHRSFLVNLACIKEVVSWFSGRYILTVTDAETSEVPVSRRRVKALKDKLGL